MTIKVGPTDTEFGVYKPFICDMSRFFKAWFEGIFREAREATLRLPEENVAMFKRFLLWLYTGEVHASTSATRILPGLYASICTSSPKPTKSSIFKTKLSMYLLTERTAYRRFPPGSSGGFTKTHCPRIRCTGCASTGACTTSWLTMCHASPPKRSSSSQKKFLLKLVRA